MSTAFTDINKIMEECKPLLLRATTVETETHYKCTVDEVYGKHCGYELIYCFYDGIKNNYYHLLVRICKCDAKYTDFTSWLCEARKGYMDFSDIQSGIELHFNKPDYTKDCVYTDRTNPEDKEETSYLLKQQYCNCTKDAPSMLRTQ